MGYFDGLTASIFKTNEIGQVIFYPWGIIGKGYILSCEEKQIKVRKFIKLYYIVSLSLIIGIQIALGWLYNIILLPFLFAWYYFTIINYLKGLSKTDEKLTMKESATNSAKAHNIETLWAMLIASVLFVLAGIFILIANMDKWIIALMDIVFFGVSSIKIAYMIKQRNT